MSERDAVEDEVFTHAGTPITVTIAPKCDGDTGRWYCARHNLIFNNNMQAESHRGERGEHVMAWWCHVHGPEVP